MSQLGLGNTYYFDCLCRYAAGRGSMPGYARADVYRDLFDRRGEAAAGRNIYRIRRALDTLEMGAWAEGRVERRKDAALKKTAPLREGLSREAMRRKREVR